MLRGTDWSSFALAPVYDIASTVVYGGLDRRMAMRIGSTNKIDEVGQGVGGAASDVLRDTEDALGAPLSKLRDIEEFARSQIDRLGIKGA